MLNDVIEKIYYYYYELIKSKLKKKFKRNINWNGMEFTMARLNRWCVISLGWHKISNGSIGARRIEGSILLLYIQPQHVSVTWQWPTKLVYRQWMSWDVVSNRSCLAALPLPAVKWNAAWARDTAWIWLLLILLDWLRLGHRNWRDVYIKVDWMALNCWTETLLRHGSCPMATPRRAENRFGENTTASDQVADISVRKWPPIWGSMQQVIEIWTGMAGTGSASPCQRQQAGPALQVAIHAATAPRSGCLSANRLEASWTWRDCHLPLDELTNSLHIAWHRCFPKEDHQWMHH